MATTTAATATSGDVLAALNINPFGGLDVYLNAVKGQPRNGRLKCDNGRLLLASPGLPRESAGGRLNIVLKEAFDVLDIPARALASTLYRRPREKGRKDRGAEPDRSDDIQNFERVRRSQSIDPRACPPPDLVVEVVHSNPAELALGVYRKLGVPEVWVYDVGTGALTVRTLVPRADGSYPYRRTVQSVVLPFLGDADIAPWCGFTDEDDTAFKRRARAWAETVLVPRVRDGGTGG